MNRQLSYKTFIRYLEQPVSIAPLVVFRIAFGLLMLFSTTRYLMMGWVSSQLIEPKLHFSYYGFDWVTPLPGNWMYVVFGLMILASIGIALGAYYRWATILFFVCFTYVELIDITYYLNHYYFVSLVAFLLILVPANRCFSWDVIRNPSIAQRNTSRWCIAIFQLQIAIVYIYAGLAKINHDWMIRALPLSLWLPAKTSIPVIGWIFKFKITAYLFSWMGMLFDTLIVFGLLMRRTRWVSYLAVIVFHTITGILFQIGIFPLVMIFVVTIFFSADFHERLIDRINQGFGRHGIFSEREVTSTLVLSNKERLIYPFLVLFFLFQVLFPWRYLLYPGNIFWTEEGYRFAWRVMLMEKAGTATFYVKDGPTGREGSVINSQFLNMHQEKQMAMQPDLILQFAHYLADHYRNRGMNNPQVRAEVQATLNARPSQLLIDPQINLAQVKDTWQPKTWINPYPEYNLK